MINLQLIHNFVKDPMTDKLFRKYVSDPKARRAFDQTVRLVELAVIAAPLIMTVANSIGDMMRSQENTRRRRNDRQLMPA
jgi:hypothetical protein